MVELYQALCLGAEGWNCSAGWLMMIVLFFAAAIYRRQVAESFNMNYSLIGGVIVGELVFAITKNIFTSMKFPFILGLVGVIAGGYIGGFWDDSDGGGYGD